MEDKEENFKPDRKKNSHLKKKNPKPHIIFMKQE